MKLKSMNKYKRFIKLELGNIQEIINLPIFRNMYKSETSDDVGLYTTFVFEFDTGLYNFVGRLGGYIAEDICGNWISMSESEYNKRKNDKILEKQQ